MSFIYKVNENRLLEDRNVIFQQFGVDTLRKNGFIQSPFSTAWFGRNNLGDYTYEFCRIAESGLLEIVLVHISKGDKWIKVFLNIFELKPKVNSIMQLGGVDGLQYHLPPNSLTNMRLGSRVATVGFGSYKLRFYYSDKSYQKSLKKLGSFIKSDLAKIRKFVIIWHDLNNTLETNWEGIGPKNN